MTNAYEIFKTEDNLETNGVWKEYGGVVKVKIARAGNKNTAFNKALAKAADKYRGANPEKQSKREIEEPWVEVYVKELIKGIQVKEGNKWVDGVHLPDAKGNIVLSEANRINMTKFFLDLPDLFSRIKDDANEMKTFQKEKEEEDLKN